MLTIVGGGSTGLITLSVLAKKGLNCKVYEATDRIGGILRDVSSQNSHYFSGCQYLDTNNDWFDSLPDQDLLGFNQSYASFTDLFGMDSISREFSGPVYDGHVPPLGIDLDLQNSAHDKIMGYPSVVREGLLSWLTMLGVNPRYFHTSSLKPLGASRIHFRSHEEKVKSLRAENHLFSEYFGIPFANHGIMLPAVIPRFGYSRYFDDHFGVKYRESIAKLTPVQIKYESGAFILKSNKAPEIESEKILWSGNPNPIFRALGMDALDSFNFKCQLICGEVKHWDQEPFYVQVFSKNSKVLRIFLYEMNGISRFTIEKAYGVESIENTCQFAEEILFKLGLNVGLEPRGIWTQNRFNLLTVNDYESITKLDNILQDTNLLSGSWRNYNRNSKISSITASVLG
jgi:hypothetical protein